MTDEYFEALVSLKVDGNNPLSSVLPVSSLHDYLEMMIGLIEGEAPTEVPSRLTKHVDEVNVWVDSSGRGLGRKTQKAKSEKLNVRVGVW